jgi:hypothetical protein
MLSDNEIHELVLLLQSQSQLVRLNNDEAIAVIRLAEALGYTISVPA